MLNRLLHDLGQRRPSYGCDSTDELIFHEVYRFSEEEYSNLMAGFGEGVRVQKGEACFCGIVRSPMRF